MLGEFDLLAVAAAEVGPGELDRIGALDDQIAMLVRVLHHHHTAEDDGIWPIIRAADPAAGAIFDRLEADHDELQLLLDEVNDSSRPIGLRAPVLRALHTKLCEHLACEERDGVPLIGRHVSAAQWDEIGERMLASTDRKDLPAIVGWLHQHATPEQWRHVE